MKGDQQMSVQMTQSPHLDKDWLYQKYIVENLSTYDIAKIVHRDAKSVYNQLRKFNIPTRKRGENLKREADGNDNYMLRPGVENPFKGRRHTEETRKILSEKASCPKPYLRGNKNGMYGRIGLLNPNCKGGNTPERQRLYGSSKWQEILREVHARANYKCQRCGLKMSTEVRFNTHHIKPWQKYPRYRLDPNNIVLLCEDCHKFVHSPQNLDKELIFK